MRLLLDGVGSFSAAKKETASTYKKRWSGCLVYSCLCCIARYEVKLIRVITVRSLLSIMTRSGPGGADIRRYGQDLIISVHLCSFVFGFFFLKTISNKNE